MTSEQLALRDELNRMYKEHQKEVCKQKQREYYRKYAEEHKEERREYQKQYYQRNKERYRESNKKWREKNPEAAKRVHENSILRQAERILARREQELKGEQA